MKKKNNTVILEVTSLTEIAIGFRSIYTVSGNNQYAYQLIYAIKGTIEKVV